MDDHYHHYRLGRPQTGNRLRPAAVAHGKRAGAADDLNIARAATRQPSLASCRGLASWMFAGADDLYIVRAATSSPETDPVLC